MTAAPPLPHRRIAVALDRDPYEVVIGEGSLKDIGEALLQAGVREGRQVLVVSNPDVADRYGKVCIESLKRMASRRAGADPSRRTAQNTLDGDADS